MKTEKYLVQVEALDFGKYNPATDLEHLGLDRLDGAFFQMCVSCTLFKSIGQRGCLSWFAFLWRQSYPEGKSSSIVFT